MIKVLHSRLARVEEDTRDRWLARPEARDPWAWTKRFAAATPRYAEMVEWALVPGRSDWTVRPEKEPPYLRADGLVAVMIRATKPWTRPREHGDLRDPAEAKRYFENWTQEQMDALLMFGELSELGRAYIAAAGDPAPWPLTWAHPSLFQNRRGGPRRRS